MINKKMKNYLLSGIATMAMFGATMLITSCDTESDLEVVNPDQEALDANWLAEFGQIDENQDWSLATTAKAAISVYGIDALSDYQLQLYTENPISSSNALLIASKKVTTDENGNASVDFDAIDVQKGVSTYYACYMDRYNRKNVQPVSLIDGTITAQFGSQSSETRAGMKKTATADNSADAKNLIPSVGDPTNDVMGKYSSSVPEVSASNYAYTNKDNSSNYAEVLQISKDNTWTGSIPVMNEDNTRTLYVNGTWDLTGAQNKSQAIGHSSMVVVCRGGKINIPDGYVLESCTSGRIVILPGGEISGNGELYFHNGSGTTFDYNAGTINVNKLYCTGGDCYFYNYGQVTATEFDGHNNYNFVNHGLTTIDHCTSGCQARILNGCQLSVTKNLETIYLTMGENSYTSVGGDLRLANGQNATILIAKNSQLKVTGGIAFPAAKIVGPTTGWSVCEFGHIGLDDINTYGSWNSSYIANNLYVSVKYPSEKGGAYNLTPYGLFECQILNGHETNVVSNESNNYKGERVWTGNYMGNGHAVLIEEGTANVAIPATSCANSTVSVINPGYTPKTVAGSSYASQNFIIACEDMGSTLDNDFNDVVFSVGHVTGTKYITIAPLAAGGTLAATIYYNDTPIGEIHEMLGTSDTNQMINTTSAGITNGGSTKTIDVDDANWTFASNFEKFSVKVQGNNDTSKFLKAPEKGTAPFMIAVPANWQWPLEYKNIGTAYPKFEGWSQDAGTNLDWTEIPASGMTVTR